MEFSYTALEEQGGTTTRSPSRFAAKKTIIIAVVSVVMLLGIIVLIVGVTSKNTAQSSAQNYVFNEEIVLLISIDGFRMEYIERGIMPNLQLLANLGIMSEGLISSFPSLTFPNHYTIVTGLFPESHGIVANEFFDPTFNETFSLKDPNDAKWWFGEPIWNTVQNAGMKSASFLWPGSMSNINGQMPTYYIPKYNGSITPTEKFQKTLEWIDLPKSMRPNFLSVYIPEIDMVGHHAGVDSNEMTDALISLDHDFKGLISGLKQRGVYDKTNILIVSDHGMATLSNTKIIFLYDIIAKDSLSHVYGYATVFLYPKDIQITFDKLKAKENHFKVYKKENFPQSFHFSQSVRISPIVILMEIGWIMSFQSSSSQENIEGQGGHGFSPMEPHMLGLFIAHGPNIINNSFSYDISQNRAPPFHNYHIYNFMCHLLGLKAAPSNGTDILQRLLINK